jgi:hypothetical protein
VPFLAVIWVVVQGSVQMAVAVVGGIGLAAFGLAFWMALDIRHDLATLAQAIQPAGQWLGGRSDATDSFWTASR